MKTINIHASRDYDVKIGSGLLPSLGAEVAALCKVGTAAILSDSNVWPIYGDTVSAALQNSGLRVVNYVFPAGEESKSAENYLNILNFLADNHITRTDLLIALGGGVVGDITGFAAATYLRGIPYIQIPTTLLAMVDSSVGGKTAIDLPGGKNLVGAFYQPSLVLCDLETLKSLPEDIFRDGCAEVIKYGILFDPDLFVHLLENGILFDREAVVARCVALKRDVVATDEHDRGERQLLNLGHTIAHGIEAVSNFTVSHGKAVAIGTAIISRSAYANGMCSEDTYRSILSVLSAFSLPTDTTVDMDAIIRIALSDKKRSGQNINLVLPTQIGKCIISPTPIDSLKGFLEKGL